VPKTRLATALVVPTLQKSQNEICVCDFARSTTNDGCEGRREGQVSRESRRHREGEPCRVGVGDVLRGGLQDHDRGHIADEIREERGHAGETPGGVHTEGGEELQQVRRQARLLGTTDHDEQAREERNEGPVDALLKLLGLSRPRQQHGRAPEHRGERRRRAGHERREDGNAHRRTLVGLSFVHHRRGRVVQSHLDGRESAPMHERDDGDIHGERHEGNRSEQQREMPIRNV
jgi:hypothetical protein